MPFAGRRLMSVQRHELNALRTHAVAARRANGMFQRLLLAQGTLPSAAEQAAATCLQELDRSATALYLQALTRRGADASKRARLMRVELP